MVNMEIVLISITRGWAGGGDRSSRVFVLLIGGVEKASEGGSRGKKNEKGKEKNGDRRKRGLQIGVG